MAMAACHAPDRSNQGEIMRPTIVLAVVAWLATHAHVVNGKTVLDVGGKQRTLPRADLSQLTQAVTLP
jgi:hypothetical protein